MNNPLPKKTLRDLVDAIRVALRSREFGEFEYAGETMHEILAMEVNAQRSLKEPFTLSLEARACLGWIVKLPQGPMREDVERFWGVFLEPRAGVALKPGVQQVYVVRSGTGGRVKIGRSRNIKRRLASLQTSLPDRLYLLAVVDGGAELERELHARFHDARFRGEWFDCTEAVLAWIDTLPKEGELTWATLYG